MRFTLLTLLLVFCLRVSGQDLMTVDYTFAISNLPENETVQLAYYLGGKTYMRHEFGTSVTGIFNYKADSVHRGMYLLYFKQKGDFAQLIFNEPKFSMAIDYKDLLGSAKVDGSRENQVYYDYLRYLDQRHREIESIKNEVGLTESQKAQKQTALNKEVKAQQRSIIEGNPNTLVTAFIQATLEPEIPNAPAGLSETEAQDWRSYYYRDHYFDDFDLSNSSLLYTPVFQNKLDVYRNQLTPQEPDSMIAMVNRVIGLAEGSQEVKRYLIINLVNEFARFKVVCMDKAYVHMVDTYYASGFADWIDKDQLNKMLSRANNLRNNLCGVKAYNFKLTSANYEQVELNQIKADWTILVFLKSDCTHCEKVLLDLKSLEPTNADYKVVTIHQKGDQNWLNQLADFKSEKWLNLIDTQGEIDWEKQYNLDSYPLVYVLDANKVIRYKRIEAKQIQQILSQ